MNKKAILWIFVLVVVVIVAWVVSHRAPSGPSATTESSTTTSLPVASQPAPEWPLYDSAKYGFTIAYPEGYTVKEKYTYDALGSSKSIPGVSFTIPKAMAVGTNLSSDTYLSVEVLPQGTCEARAFLDSVQAQQTATENGRTWTVAKGGGAAAGNFYDETVYAAQIGNNCYGLRLFIHSTNIGNYEPGTVTEFDRAALDNIFAQFRASFTAK